MWSVLLPQCSSGKLHVPDQAELTHHGVATTKPGWVCQARGIGMHSATAGLGAWRMAAGTWSFMAVVVC